MSHLIDALQIEADIAHAWSLPASLYRDPTVFEEEQRRIFTRSWQIMGQHAQVQNAGDYLTCELAGEPLLVVRTASGELNGFYNVCRHRAGPPAEGCGNRKLFRCGYHGWTYELSGKLFSAPEFEGAADFHPERFALRGVRVEEWLNLVFVNLDPGARPLRESLSNLPEQADGFGFEHMRLSERRTYDMKCNWKTYVDNYLEGYHLPSVHPGLNRELDYNEYIVEPHANYVRQYSPIRGAQAGDSSPRRYQEAGQGLTADYFWMFPNWMLNCYPDNVSLNIIVPIDVERTRAIFEWYLPENELSSAAAKTSVQFSDQIQIEDVKICEAVQKNLRSRSYDRGRYSVKQEKGVHAFHRMYAEAMKKN